MGHYVSYDFSKFHAFFDRMRGLSAGFQNELTRWLDTIGIEFLKEVRDQIDEKGPKDHSNLLHSFEKGKAGSVFEMAVGGGVIKLEVGTSIKYAVYVNDGHPQRPGRFVPGHWETRNGKERFVYVPEEVDEHGRSVGMVLKANWVEGFHFFDNAERIFTPQFQKEMEEKFTQWIARYLER